MGDPVGLNGAILRVDPATGAGLPDNPMASSSDPNARRLVAYGLRNPFRITTRPGTNEVWMGDVGWSEWEEIDRLVSPTSAPVENFGWPCYEGDGRQAAYDAADLSVCENLYAAGSGAVVVRGDEVVGEVTNRVTADLDPTDSTAALGFANAMRDLGSVTEKGGTLYVFSLP